MIKGSIFAASALALLLVAGCKAPVDAGKETEAIRAGDAQWNADAAARDPARFASHYAADAVDIAPGANPMHGPQAVQTGMAEAFKDPNFTLSFAADKVEIAAGGDMAYSQGHYTETQTDPASHAKVAEAGSYVTVYKKEADGTWKAVADIASPGPAPAAPAN
jgi:uncharacterized protein (TIGR02246 family)